MMMRTDSARSQLNVKTKIVSPASKQSSAGNAVLAHQRLPFSDRLVVETVYFQGKRSTTSPIDKTKKQRQAQTLKMPPLFQKLFGQPRKNMMWTLGYSVGGIMLLPIPPMATGAFCLALVHFASASYQFLTQKPGQQASPANSSSN